MSRLWGAKTITSVVDGANAIIKASAGLSGLLFVISQVLAYFAYSNIATILAADLEFGGNAAFSGPLRREIWLDRTNPCRGAA